MALALAAAADLRTRLQDPNLDDVTAQAAIDSASALVRAVARQDYDFVVGDTVVLAGGLRTLTLPQRPILVDSGHPLTVIELPDIGAQGVAVTEGLQFRRVNDKLMKAWRSRWQPGTDFISQHQPWMPAWPSGVWAPWVQVTYSHGYQTTADVPAWLSEVVVRAAVTIASNPAGLRSQSLDGEVTITYANESLRAPSSIVNDIRKQLNATGGRRGGAFSIAAT